MVGNEETPTVRIRNVVLLGHGGTGKTVLAEAMLAVGGVGDGRGGILDFEPEERDRGHSLSLAVASLSWNGHKINLLDAPGGPESIGDAYPALHAADLAVFVVDAGAGVQPQHDQLWSACEQLGLPRLVFLNKLDKENAAYQSVVDALRERCGSPLAPVHMPLGVAGEFNGIIDLLHFTAVTKTDGERKEVEVPEARREQAGRNRETLVDAIVENDDAMLERYLEGEIPDPKELSEAFAKGIASCGFFPLLCGSVAMGVGVRLLADFIVENGPSPADRSPLEAAEGTAGRDLDGPVALYVAKTLSDPYVGRINVLRVLAGRLEQDDTLVVGRTGNAVRLHQLFVLRGKDQSPITAAPAGDICAVAKLDDVVTGDVLHPKGAPLALTPVPLPEPFHRVALQPASAGDEDKLSTALARLRDEDPSLRVEQDPETAQLVLRGYGVTHIDVTLARLQRKFGVSVNQVPLRLAYRETLRGSAAATGRHVKQSGGHGQYGIAHIEVEPLERGGGLEFEDRIVGGVIPRQFIPSVEKGVREAMRQGVLAGYPVVDVRVRLVDGKHHSVDSSDMAFQVAGSLAFRNAVEQAGVVLLEPVMDVAVTVPDELTGDVMGDLSARRGRIQGTEPAAAGQTTVRAHVPESELLTYSAELRSLSSGTGTVAMAYHHHEEVPEHVAKKVIAQAAERQS
ncbi:MAG: elongation factor G [Actinomycetota bacterium]|nr:elongation factor G [Actinomycetota bacterium]